MPHFASTAEVLGDADVVTVCTVETNQTALSTLQEAEHS